MSFIFIWPKGASSLAIFGVIWQFFGANF